MGVVVRQSFWITALGYSGIVLGYVATLILRPMYLTEGEIGLLNLVISNMMMLAPVISLGMPGTYLRLVQYVKDQKKEEERIFNFQWVVILLANATLILLVWILLPVIQSIFEENSAAYNQYIFISLYILLFYSSFLHLSAYSRAKLESIFPEFIKNIFLRIGNIVLILLFAFNWISFDIMIRSLVIVYATAFLVNLAYLYYSLDYRMSFRISGISNRIRKEMFAFGSNLVFVSLGGTIANQIFFLLVSVLIGLDDNGIFTVCFYIATVIEMPKRSMVQVIVPVFASEFRKNNMSEIENLYKKSSLTLSVFAMLFLIGVVCNLNELFLIIPNGEIYKSGIMVVILVSAAKVIDLAFGFNSELINYSGFYRYLPFFSLIYGFVTVVICLILIPVWGINGAALSFLISMLLYNLLKFIFLKIKLGISPFVTGHLITLALAVGTFLLTSFINFGLPPIPTIILKSIFITLIYGFFVYFLKISPDINNLADQMIQRVFKRKK